MKLVHHDSRQYELLEGTRIQTSNGAVYKGQDLSLKRIVAVKVQNIQASSPAAFSTAARQALHEAEMLILLEKYHVNIPHLYDAWSDQNRQQVYIVEEWLEGETLQTRMASHKQQDQTGGPQRSEEGLFLYVILSLAEILTVFEKEKISHKDVKPDNIMLVPSATERKELVYLIDLNIAGGVSSTTEGTANYKAPEMSPGSICVDRSKADQFSIGVILYEFYTGILPTETKTYIRGRSGSHVWEQFHEPAEINPQVSPQMNQIITRCMKLDPKDRYRNMNDLIRALNNYRSSRRGRR